MNINVEKINGFSVLSIQDERIDAHNSNELKESIARLIEQGEHHLVVQLDKVRFIDSSGLGALLSGHKITAARSGKLVLSGCSPQVTSMFELTRLNRIFEIFSDLNELFESD